MSSHPSFNHPPVLYFDFHQPFVLLELDPDPLSE